jgi:hypothetical protein
MTQQALNPWPQTLVGAGVLLIGLALAAGALTSPVTPATVASAPTSCPGSVPWCSLCGAWIVWEARTGGFRQMDEPTGRRARWPAFIWVSAGLLANAALITTHRLHPELHAVLCAGGAGPAPRGEPARRQQPARLGHRCDTVGHLGAGVLDVHAVPGHQSAGPHQRRAGSDHGHSQRIDAGLCLCHYRQQPAVVFRGLCAWHGRGRVARHRPRCGCGHAAADHRQGGHHRVHDLLLRASITARCTVAPPPPSC